MQQLRNKKVFCCYLNSYYSGLYVASIVKNQGFPPYFQGFMTWLSDMLLLANAWSSLWVSGCVLNFGFLLTCTLGLEGGRNLNCHIEYRKINWRFQVNLILNTFLNFPNLILFKTVICSLVSWEPVFLSPQEGIGWGRYIRR